MNYRNNEGYASPTEYHALNRIQKEENKDKIKAKYRPLVYICSPFSHGDIKQNIINARKYSRYAVEHHCIPITPHLFFPQFMKDDIPAERDLAMFMNRILLAKCDELWVFGKVYTAGMQKEMKWARRKKLTIKFIDNI